MIFLNKIAAGGLQTRSGCGILSCANCEVSVCSMKYLQSEENGDEIKRKKKRISIKIKPFLKIQLLSKDLENLVFNI